MHQHKGMQEQQQVAGFTKENKVKNVTTKTVT
jgi:hypothetical protein